jgi:hypothetical protein
MCCGLFCAESINVRPFLFFTFLVLFGLNATSTSHVPLAVIEPPQVSPVSMNGGDTTMVVMAIAVVLDPFLTVTVCGALVMPIIAFPKLIALLGLSFSVGALTCLASVSSADCANAGPAKAVSSRNSEKVTPAIERVSESKVIVSRNFGFDVADF